MAFKPNKAQREILRFFHEDATFDVVLDGDLDRSQAEAQAMDHLLELGLIEESGDAYCLKTKGIVFMSNRVGSDAINGR